jgi:hypothetical protein
MLGVLLLIAVPVRVATMCEPLSSDDMTAFSSAENLAKGRHPLQRTLEPNSETRWYNHNGFRMGLLLPQALVIRILGSNAIAYYFLPMLASIGSIVLIFLLLSRYVGSGLAFLAAIAATVNPLDVHRSSALLTNLPVALLCITYLAGLYFLLRNSSTWRRSILAGVVGGVVLTWLYLTRLSAPVMLGPCLLGGLFLRRYRLAVFISGVVLALGILAEQAVYMSAGGEFLFRYHIVSNSVANYQQYLPRYHSFTDYLLRYPNAVKSFTDSDLIRILFYAAIALHVYTVFVGKDILLRALAVTGLMNFGLFAFGLFGPLSEGLVTVPPKVRYITMFSLTSAICVTWAIHYLSLAVLHRKARGEMPPLEGWKRKLGACIAVGYFLLFATPMALSTARLDTRLFDPSGNYRPILAGLNDIMRDNSLKRLDVTGVSASIRGLRLFTWVPGGRRLTWHRVHMDDVPDQLETGAIKTFVWDFGRERASLNYIKDPQARAAKARQLDAVEASLYRMGIVRITPRSFLVTTYPVRSALKRTPWDPPGMPFASADSGDELSAIWQCPGDEQLCRVTVTKDRWLQADCRIPPGGAAYVYQDPIGSQLPPSPETSRPMEANHLYEVAMTAKFDGNAAATLWIVEYGKGERIRVDRQKLESGGNTLLFRSSPKTTCFRVMIRLKGEGTVSISPITWYDYRPRAGIVPLL